MNTSLGDWIKGALGTERGALQVLLVDDQPVMRELVRRFMMVSGFGNCSFMEAGDGASALNLFNPRSCDLVFLDQHLPDQKGVEIAARMRSASGERHVPVIMITGDKRFGLLEDALGSALADGFLFKPFDFKEFQNCVGSALRHRQTK